MEGVAHMEPGALLRYEHFALGAAAVVCIGECTARFVSSSQYANVLWCDFDRPDLGTYVGARDRNVSRTEDVTLWRP